MIEINGGPDAIRTRDPQIRNLMLYPAELRGRRASFSTKRTASKQELAGWRLLRRRECDGVGERFLGACSASGRFSLASQRVAGLR